MTISIKDDDFLYRIFKSKEDFLNSYPRPKWGEYRPQPRDMPERYPVLAIEVETVCGWNGPDEVILLYSYDFEVSD